MHDAPEALFAALKRGQLALGLLQHQAQRLAVRIGAAQQADGQAGRARAGTGAQLQLDALGLATIEHALHELLVIVTERLVDIGTEQHVAGPFPRQAEQFGRHQVHLHDDAIETQHEIGDGRQQV